MNTTKFRVRNSKKGVTPVIATIILIAGTLVLALVVGAYTFGLFGSNVKTVTLSSANLFAGGINTPKAGTVCVNSGQSYLSFSLNNPGAATSITGLTLTGNALGSIVVITNGGSGCTPVTSSASLPLQAGQVTPITVYFSYANATDTLSYITSGQTFNYVINFQNGQSVSGSLIAQ